MSESNTVICYFSMAVITYLIFVIGAAIAFYLYSKWIYTYWKRRGVLSPKPDFFYGNVKDLIKGKQSLGEQFAVFYNIAKAKKEKHIGVYMLLGRVYVPVDLEIIKSILQKDFPHFLNHGGIFYVNEEIDPLSGHLFNLENEKWRNLRTKMTPPFTSGRLKMMFQTLLDCAPGLESILDEYTNLPDGVDIKEIVTRFTADIIGSCAFGLDCNSLKDPNSEFLYYGKKFFNPDLYTQIKNILPLLLPERVLKFLQVKGTPDDITNFFTDVVNKTVKYREDNNVFRKDFLHMLIQLKNKGKLTDDESLKKETNHEGTTITMNELIAQCFVFFVAGLETSASSITFALLELAQDQEIQNKVREEIIFILKKNNGQLTYDSLKEMSYLNKVVQETLRKHPPVSTLPRICTKDYHVPGTNLVIEKGTYVHVPIMGIQNDPEYYPDPERFDPERFSEENKSKRSQFSFLTFGEGPRQCIGTRFAYLQVKVGLIAILKNFKITLNDRTIFPIRYVTKPIVNEVKGGVWLNIEKIK